MDLRSGASSSANGQKQGEPGAVDVVRPFSKELQEQLEAITKSGRISDGIKKVITAMTRELQSLCLENSELRQELDCVRKSVPRESPPVTGVDNTSEHRSRTAFGSVPASTRVGLPYQEEERLRSIVISGVPEEKSQSTRERLSYDYANHPTAVSTASEAEAKFLTKILFINFHVICMNVRQVESRNNIKITEKPNKVRQVENNER
uniref:Uncharacterized protein n=1 Tax=Haemonchus contortus TaxID=6289 RepID=A0A7I4YUT9_HAECO